MKLLLSGALLSLLVFNANATDMVLPIRGIADGDTIKSVANLPCPLCNISVRIRGIDTPESNHLAKCPKEKQAGLQAKDYLISTTRNQTEMTARSIKWDKYGGRIDAFVEVNGVDIGQDMIKRGFARPYTGQGPKSDWCK
jgi:micrococcal nuclease